MLLVSFCDIVTITTCAMFMAMIIVIDESSKIPVVSPVPILHQTTNSPVYFECRDSMVIPIDLPALRQEFVKYSTEYKKGGGASDVEKLMNIDAGNALYRIDPGLATMGILGLQPRPGAKGTTLDEMTQTNNAYGVVNTNTLFDKMVLSLNTNSQYCVFFVRDSGFGIYRECRRRTVRKMNFRHGWEYLGRDEPITFEGMMRSPGRQ